MPQTPSRSRPRFFRWAAVLKWTGAVLCVVIFVVWFGSRWYGGEVSFYCGSSFYNRITVDCGQIGGLRVSDPRRRAPAQGFTWYGRARAGEEHWLWLPFRMTDGGPRTSTFMVSVPLYIPFVLVAIPTALLCRRDRRAARWARAGLCPGCGYDLACAPSPTCPECGKTA